MMIASDRDPFTLELDQAVYSITACKKACYALMLYTSCLISTEGTKILITATPVADVDKEVGEIKALLMDELLDYSLREMISEKTEPVRNLILSNAFSNTKLIG